MYSGLKLIYIDIEFIDIVTPFVSKNIGIWKRLYTVNRRNLWCSIQRDNVNMIESEKLFRMFTGQYCKGKSDEWKTWFGRSLFETFRLKFLPRL